MGNTLFQFLFENSIKVSWAQYGAGNSGEVANWMFPKVKNTIFHQTPLYWCKKEHFLPHSCCPEWWSWSSSVSSDPTVSESYPGHLEDHKENLIVFKMIKCTFPNPFSAKTMAEDACEIYYLSVYVNVMRITVFVIHNVSATLQPTITCAH